MDIQLAIYIMMVKNLLVKLSAIQKIWIFGAKKLDVLLLNAKPI